MDTPSTTSAIGTLRILFLNAGGAGFADFLEVAVGTTIEQLIQRQVSYARPEDLLIRVNRQPVPRSYVLQADDRVSAVPTKIEGAV